MKRWTIFLAMFMSITASTSLASAEPKLPAHCKKVIEFDATSEDKADAEFMRVKLETAELLATFVPIAPFAAMFDANPAKMAWNIADPIGTVSGKALKTEADVWNAWVDALSSLDDGLRGVLRKHARDIRGKYELRNDRKRAKYWECVQRSFD